AASEAAPESSAANSAKSNLSTTTRHLYQWPRSRGIPSKKWATLSKSSNSHLQPSTCNLRLLILSSYFDQHHRLRRNRHHHLTSDYLCPLEQARLDRVGPIKRVDRIHRRSRQNPPAYCTGCSAGNCDRNISRPVWIQIDDRKMHLAVFVARG